jgi:hypothetical protein
VRRLATPPVQILAFRLRAAGQRSRREGGSHGRILTAAYTDAFALLRDAVNRRDPAAILSAVEQPGPDGQRLACRFGAAGFDPEPSGPT